MPMTTPANLGLSLAAFPLIIFVLYFSADRQEENPLSLSLSRRQRVFNSALANRIDVPPVELSSRKLNSSARNVNTMRVSAVLLPQTRSGGQVLRAPGRAHTASTSAAGHLRAIFIWLVEAPRLTARSSPSEQSFVRTEIRATNFRGPRNFAPKPRGRHLAGRTCQHIRFRRRRPAIESSIMRQRWPL